jgi:hypothetical protein
MDGFFHFTVFHGISTTCLLSLLSFIQEINSSTS